jgi:hypothetical protein
VSISKSKNGKKGESNHPFAKKEPKPTRARLVSLLDPLGRKRYSEVERFLATVNGATSGLHYFDTDWGWAVRYMLGAKEQLCTLHLLPNSFEATVGMHNMLDLNSNGAISPELKRRIARTRPVKDVRWVRMPIRSDADYSSFQHVIRTKAEYLATKEKSGSSKATKAKAKEPVAAGMAVAAKA